MRDKNKPNTVIKIPNNGVHNQDEWYNDPPVVLDGQTDVNSEKINNIGKSGESETTPTTMEQNNINNGQCFIKPVYVANNQSPLYPEEHIIQL